MLSQRNLSVFSLIALSFLILISVSEYWYYTPDGGIYIGTALNMLNHGEYTFNGYPNLQYYPGFSTLLATPLSIFGMDFYILNLFSALIIITLLWVSSLYFNASKYGSVILFLPLILLSSSIFQLQILYLLSGASFLLIVILIALLWRQYTQNSSNKILLFCVLLVSISPLFRFEGLFVILSFSLSYLINDYKIRNKVFPSLFKAGILSLIIFLPFALWTLRNYILYTPDTFNMANNTFFGLKGLSLYAPDYHKVDWIEPGSWKYGAHHLYMTLKAIADSFISQTINIATFSGELFRLFFLLSVGALGLYGIKGWLKKINNFELLFVTLLTSYLIYRSLKAQNLYIIVRYWLPLLPFYISIVLIGYTDLTKNIKNKLSKYSIIVPAIVILATVLINGAKFASVKNSTVRDEYYSHAEVVLNSMSAYLNKIADKKTVLASTDWGVLPLYLQRKSIKLLNDDSLDYKLSMERMVRFQTQYLIILDGNATIYASARRMTKAYPKLFQLESHFEPENNIGPLGSIYKINLDKVSLLLNKKTTLK